MKRWSILVLLLLPLQAQAHQSASAGGLEYWTLDPWILLPLGTVSVLYILGLWKLRRRGARQGLPFWRVLSFASGVLALFLALIWPLDALSESSFAAHMTQHMLLMLLAAPLLALSAAWPVLLQALPASWRRPLRLPLWLQRPAPAFLVHGVLIWVWHAPAAFALALAHPMMHILEHLSFFLSGLWFWWAVLHQSRPENAGVGALWILATLIHTGMLGALLTFAPAPLYPGYGIVAARAGLSALEDQQLAGLIMWVPAGFLYMVVGLGLLWQAWRRLERRFPEPVSGQER